MKVLVVFFFAMMSMVSFFAEARSLAGEWQSEDGSTVVQLEEHNGLLTFSTRAYYKDGTPVNYDFEFRLPRYSEVTRGRHLKGRVRSEDGYIGCQFNEPAYAQLLMEGVLQLDFPLLTFRRTNNCGHCECQIEYRKWHRATLIPVEETPVPRPN